MKKLERKNNLYFIGTKESIYFNNLVKEMYVYDKSKLNTYCLDVNSSYKDKLAFFHKAELDQGSIFIFDFTILDSVSLNLLERLRLIRRPYPIVAIGIHKDVDSDKIVAQMRKNKMNFIYPLTSEYEELKLAARVTWDLILTKNFKREYAVAKIDRESSIELDAYLSKLSKNEIRFELAQSIKENEDIELENPLMRDLKFKSQLKVDTHFSDCQQNLNVQTIASEYSLTTKEEYKALLHQVDEEINESGKEIPLDERKKMLNEKIRVLYLERSEDYEKWYQSKSRFFTYNELENIVCISKKAFLTEIKDKLAESFKLQRQTKLRASANHVLKKNFKYLVFDFDVVEDSNGVYKDKIYEDNHFKTFENLLERLHEKIFNEKLKVIVFNSPLKEDELKKKFHNNELIVFEREMNNARLDECIKELELKEKKLSKERAREQLEDKKDKLSKMTAILEEKRKEEQKLNLPVFIDTKLEEARSIVRVNATIDEISENRLVFSSKVRFHDYDMLTVNFGSKSFLVTILPNEKLDQQNSRNSIKQYICFINRMNETMRGKLRAFVIRYNEQYEGKQDAS